jgi:hypothetical protein
MLGIGEDMLGMPSLDDLTKAHHRNPITDVTDNTQIVTYEEISKPKFAPSLLE